MSRSRPPTRSDRRNDGRPYGRDGEGRDPYSRDSYGYAQDRGRRDPYADGRRSPPSGGGGGMPITMASAAVLAGVLVVGIGIGSAVTSTTQGNQGNIASSQQLDMAVPDPEFCKQWGASAFVMDVELYTTMNPSSSFVTQPTLQPGCVIRRENWSVLQKQGAVTAEQMRQCKQRMNTFAYIGSIRDKPIVRCVYQTDVSGNKFQTPGVAGAADDSVGITPEADQF
ncbi:MAG: DUF3172 domain-containing protein [Cyanobacteriota bacterium]|nr:DUF3172 domain-containing protein [Cyanobacteriota bacterium]